MVAVRLVFSLGLVSPVDVGEAVGEALAFGVAVGFGEALGFGVAVAFGEAVGFGVAVAVAVCAGEGGGDCEGCCTGIGVSRAGEGMLTPGGGVSMRGRLCGLGLIGRTGSMLGACGRERGDCAG